MQINKKLIKTTGLIIFVITFIFSTLEAKNLINTEKQKI